VERPAVAMMERAPALLLAGAFVAGIAAGPHFDGPIFVGLSVFFLFSALASLSKKWPLPASTAFVLVAFACLGVSAHWSGRRALDKQPLLVLYQALGAEAFETPALVEGKLLRDPERREDSTVLWVQVERLWLRRRAWNSRGGLRISVRGAYTYRSGLEELRSGDRVRAWAIVRRPGGYRNPGSFDIEEYYGRQGITLTGSVKSGFLVECTTAVPRWLSWISHLRAHVRSRIRKAFASIGRSDEAPGVVVALLIGDRSLIPADAVALYQRAGTFHVIAISGAHVGLLVWFLFASMRRAGVALAPTLVLLLAVLPLYAVLCGGRPSVVRAVVMGLCVVGGKLLDLDSPGLNGLGLSALVLLAFHPLDLFDPGFQLSFVAAGCILVFAGPLACRLSPQLGAVGSLFAVSLAAQAGIVPIMAWHFCRLTPVGLVANLVVMPLAGGLMASGALLVVLGEVPWLGEGLTWMVWLLVKGLTFTSQLAVAVPGGSIRVLHPALWWVAAYLLGLLAAGAIGSRRAGVVALFSLTLWLIFQPQRVSPSSQLRMTAVDVGHGDAILLELPDGERMLVDAGGSYHRTFDVGESVVVPALLHLGVRELDAVVVTHADSDHIGGLSAVVANLRVGEIWLGAPAWHRPVYREVRERARERGVAVRRVRSGDSLRIGRVHWKVLSGGKGGEGGNGSNDESIVLRATFGKAVVLLMGDAGEVVERRLVRWRESVRADVIKVGHHGSRSATIPAFLEAVRPRVAVVSTGGSSLFRLPAPRVLQRLSARSSTILRTDHDGAVTVSLDREGRIEIETYVQLQEFNAKARRRQDAKWP
jgi:competence protein ComEC